MGRGFSEEEDQPGEDGVVVITDRMWRNRFEGDQNILGGKLSLNGRPFEIIGVLPPSFRFPQPKRLSPFAADLPETEIFKPIAFNDQDEDRRGNFNYGAIGRLRENVTISGAQSELNVIQAAISREIYPESKEPLTSVLQPLHRTLVTQIQKGLLLAIATVGMVLLIACVNIANLTLARASGRSRESAIRAALGAGRHTLLRQALTESLCLATFGGILGVLAAHQIVGYVVRCSLADLPRLNDVSVDWTVLGFSVLAVLASGPLFGLTPAWQVSRTHPQEAMQSGSRGSTEGKTNRLRGILVGAEIALSTVLLIAAGLLLNSFFRVMSRDRGFAIEKIVSVKITLPSTKYKDHEPRLEAYRGMLRRLRELPGVRAVGAISNLPLTQETNVNPTQDLDALKTSWQKTSGAPER